MRDKKTNIDTRMLIFLSIILLCLSVLLIVFFLIYSKKITVDEREVTYDKYYCLIADDSNSTLWQSVYKATSQAGREKNAYVEMIQDSLSSDYSKYELMDIAIDSGVDGIIVSADENEEMSELISKAVMNNIPVVTLFSDDANSERLSFVGIAKYNLGKEYGNLIIDAVKAKPSNKDNYEVMILVDQGTETSSQNVLTLAIQETIDKENLEANSKHGHINVSSFLIDPTNNFSVEESVRNIFMQRADELPDIIVCLNEIDTTCLYQAVVDYNQVGLMTILGYYDSEAILKGIERNVIYASVSIDTMQMGQFCIDALSEYYETGNTSQYFVGDISIITKDNVGEFLRRDNDER